jgi:hypothetical protein
MIPEHTIYLSRRNLLTLLNKLDRQKAGGLSACTIIKNDTAHPTYPQTMTSINVVAVEDDDYYSDRDAGAVLPLDDPERLDK